MAHLKGARHGESTPGPGRTAMGCVAENTPEFLSRALNLLRSVRWFGGSMAEVDFFVCVVNGVEPEQARRYERLGAFVRTAPPFSRRLPLSNKLRLLELPEIKTYDTVMLIDCDTVVVQDPRPFLHGESLQAKIADLPTTPHHLFQRLFQLFDLPTPGRDYRCTLNNTPTIWYCNTGVLVFPRPILSTLGPAWGRMVRALLELHDVFGRRAYFREQAGLSLAFTAQPAPFRELPPDMNFPLHLIRERAPSSLQRCDPVILHYHDLVDSNGYLRPVSHPAARKRIEMFNERLRRCRRGGASAAGGPARSHVSKTRRPRCDAGRRGPVRTIPREKPRRDGDDAPFKPAFIVGCMRSCTTLLAEMLGRLDGVVYCPFELKGIWSGKGGVPMSSPGTRDAICPSLGPDDVMEGQADRLARAFLVEMEKNRRDGLDRRDQRENAIFLNKNPHLCNKLPFVEALFPDARFIWIHRRLPRVVASLKALFETIHLRRRIRHYWPKPRPGVATRCWEAIHTACLPEGVDPERCFPGGDVKRLAEYWLESNRAVDAFFRTLPPRRRLAIRAERLIRSPGAWLARCRAFLGLPPGEPLENAGIEPDRTRDQLWRSRLQGDERERLLEFVTENQRAMDDLFPGENEATRCGEELESSLAHRNGSLTMKSNVTPCKSLDVLRLDKTAHAAAMLANVGKGPAVQLNETGRLVWSLCNGARALPDVLHEMAAHFDGVDKETRARDLEEFVDDLIRRGFLHLPFEREPMGSSEKDDAEQKTRGIRTVCLTLGPYRNLTTLTAGIVSLHPSCQVLNHGAIRILSDKRVNFLQDYSESKFHRFVRRVISMSREWRAGLHGGSILTSHAFFNHDIMKKSYRDRYGQTLLKKDVKCLFWKDSMQLSNFIKRKRPDLADIFARNDRLKFLTPIRNPMDCAISNYRHHVSRYLELEVFSLENILERSLKEIAWFLDRQDAHPGRFFCYFENEFDEHLLARLAEFLQIDADHQWIRDALACYRLKKPYTHSPELIDLYDRLIRSRFSGRPAILKKLAKFSEQAEPMDPNAPPRPHADVIHLDELASVAALLVKKGPSRLLDAAEESIWRLCDGARTREEILETLAARSGAEKIALKQDPGAFIDSLINQGFLTLSPRAERRG
ncbi:MAG: PqqD family peptide modification chaperone [Desulfobacterales bacterium]|nr:PqqD family peptide modification chaperone [Desulfobacterales bacterium]